jgi:hypothetical protein
MDDDERVMPEIVQELHKRAFDYADGEGIDFEPYTEFLSAKDTQDWIRGWTGNQGLDGLEYRVFGQDGSGGYAAFWCVREKARLLEQPIVFLGSEGERAVIARNFADYLWLLAGGFGPYEACAYPEAERSPNPDFVAFALAHAADARAEPRLVLAAAQKEFPNFGDLVSEVCR